ncbi:TasA family protein [Aeromicrobium sp. NPDC092404]|uniref:TasA family protein n=1 Tax=Aeromicrobium sp. NPDC092404 TaxID=3154976 RepID=UPI00342953F2
MLSLGVVLGFGAVGTLAYWTDSATLAGGTFTAGNLDIKLGSPAPGVDNDPAAFTTDFAMTNMQPGDSKAAVVAVRNAGSLDFTYTATGTAPGALNSTLVFRVVPGGTVSGGTCTGGTQTFNGSLGAGNTAVIATNRPLASSASENFCVSASIPAAATTGQGQSTTASFTFNAKQVGAP